MAAISGIGVGGFWPAQSTLITGLTPPEQRPSAFAMQRVVMNLGVGLGALTGGLIATTSSPETFVVLFLLDAATFLVYAFVMYALVPEPDLRASGHAGRTGSYRDVLRHRPFVAVAALNALFIFAGYSGFDILPVYAKNEAGLSETSIGLLFLVNTRRHHLRAASDRSLLARAQEDADARALRPALGRGVAARPGRGRGDHPRRHFSCSPS